MDAEMRTMCIYFAFVRALTVRVYSHYIFLSAAVHAVDIAAYFFNPSFKL